MMPVLSTANVERRPTAPIPTRIFGADRRVRDILPGVWPITILQRLFPIRAPIALTNGRGTRIKKG
jgi:hypothetical protein